MTFCAEDLLRAREEAHNFRVELERTKRWIQAVRDIAENEKREAETQMRTLSGVHGATQYHSGRAHVANAVLRALREDK